MATERQAQLPVVTVPRLHVDQSAPNAMNNKGEKPPTKACYLTTASFPEGLKKAKGDYNPRPPPSPGRIEEGEGRLQSAPSAFFDPSGKLAVGPIAGRE
ncbi:hypothetical protein PHYSODRAFT_335676 [Phytophthora sojae]|uniref:Uncharacterized protein n=1 Tax=Phytophthora sojae (strain P6497) TaxID=1094619 RepID=G4ZRV7_PHYSP|nr:hypothetical protein PHYSODRAFT_335676 [Phytophthora sojae]EGZ13994.1 hypothetical protein PHYSODRAFT_335676 [Phytophthora sojae]|eukprot:XP_009531423.1 hypothetical protein PHYSODRAFT_335676 [Phytophthora sojae]